MTSDSSVLVTMRHVRAAGVCASGTRAWFKATGLDFAVFCRQGLPAETIEAAGGATALTVAALARKESNDGR